MRRWMVRLFVGILAAASVVSRAADSSQRFVFPGAAGKLTYTSDARGNRIPDFSHCGYLGGGIAIPEVPVRVLVAPSKEDNGARIQAAIDYLSALPPDEHGQRGAVLLLAGRHEVAGQLRISTNGVVLRGQGTGPEGTRLIATGTDRRTLIRIAGTSDRRIISTAPSIVSDSYVPVGADQLRLDHADGLKAGDTVLINQPSTKSWIAAVGMNRFPSRDVGSWLDWRPGTMDIHWERVITGIHGNSVSLDVPLTAALDAAFGRATLSEYAWPGRIRHVGVENLYCESAFDAGNPHDEQHAWGAIGLENVADAWVRQVKVAHFAGSAVAIWESCRAITVEDCVSLVPVSEMGGYRRHTFFTAGQQTLFQRCTAEQGRHDFAVGYLAAGPNAFVDCAATGAADFSGPTESWASGVLYDNVSMDGGGLALTNRETAFQGVGWAAANCVLWQCTAPIITCRQPPTAQNWAIGVWGEFIGDGQWRSLNEFVDPDSLYRAQLADRLGPAAVANTTRRMIPDQAETAPAVDSVVDLNQRRDLQPNSQLQPVAVRNGWLVVDGQLLTGGRTGTVWWRGHVLPSRAGELGVGVTRFVPGRDGRGYTDDFEELTAEMLARNQVLLEHHWGLWYDRRRDDHQMIRRGNADVWPPFYEQPWARSGQGTAWDGLSKYDLTKFNEWYFSRLQEFAGWCDRRGLVLVQQMYFQHNLLEAGAHWADFPWRPANCLQDTGFPEPPSYVGKKRVFMADAFYDVSHPVRRSLHRKYIRRCLDSLGRHTNVIFMMGEEFTGPLAFAQFWLDTVGEWQAEQCRRVLIGLSCTKDVQEAILADPPRAALVSVIDLKYWWYTATGGLYDPPGGKSQAPRQQLREWQGSTSRSDEQIARQIREYRLRFPDKAILCSLTADDGWRVLAAGGSVPKLPRVRSDRLLAALTRMRPVESGSNSVQQLVLAEPGQNYLVHSTASSPIQLDLSDIEGKFKAYSINHHSGDMIELGQIVRGGSMMVVPVSGPGVHLLWLTQQRE